MYMMYVHVCVCAELVKHIHAFELDAMGNFII